MARNKRGLKKVSKRNWKVENRNIRKVRIPDAVWSELREKAKLLGLPMAELIREGAIQFDDGSEVLNEFHRERLAAELRYHEEVLGRIRDKHGRVTDIHAVISQVSLLVADLRLKIVSVNERELLDIVRRDVRNLRLKLRDLSGDRLTEKAMEKIAEKVVDKMAANSRRF